MRSKLTFVVATVSMLVVFQNCAKMGTSVNEATGTPEHIVGDASRYNKVVYDPELEAPMSPPSPLLVRVEIELDPGLISLTQDVPDAATHQCQVDNGRLQSLRDLLSNSDVCEPGPFPPGTAMCMIAGVADIELSNSVSSLELRPVMCGYGRGLCGDHDEQLRALLADLRDHPPAGCL